MFKRRTWPDCNNAKRSPVSQDLRGYLMLMTVMLLYHVLDLAGALKHFKL